MGGDLLGDDVVVDDEGGEDFFVSVVLEARNRLGVSPSCMDLIEEERANGADKEDAFVSVIPSRSALLSPGACRRKLLSLAVMPSMLDNMRSLFERMSDFFSEREFPWSHRSDLRAEVDKGGPFAQAGGTRDGADGAWPNSTFLFSITLGIPVNCELLLVEEPELSVLVVVRLAGAKAGKISSLLFLDDDDDVSWGLFCLPCPPQACAPRCCRCFHEYSLIQYLNSVP